MKWSSLKFYLSIFCVLYFLLSVVEANSQNRLSAVKKKGATNGSSLVIITKNTPKISASDTVVCEGGSVNLIAKSCLGGKVIWTDGLSGNVITIKPSVSKSYKAICLTDKRISDSSSSIRIRVVPKPTVPQITASEKEVCAGGTSILSSNSCNSGVLFWSEGKTGKSIVVSPQKDKYYRAVCQEKGCKSDSSEKVIVNIISPPSSPSIISNVTCESSPSYFDWSRSYGGTSTDILTSSLPTSEGGFLLGGYSCSNMGLSKSEDSRGAFDYWVLKIDSQGLKLWDKTFGGNDNDHLLGLQPSSDGGYILGGSSVSNISKDKSTLSRGGYDYWVVKIDVNGNKVWDKSFGGKNYDYLTNIVSTPDGGYLLVGYSNSQVEGNKTGTNKGNFDYWVVKIDGNGNKVWDKTYGGSKHDITTGAILTRDNSFIILGYSYSGVSSDKSSSNQGDSDIWLLKINSVGSIIWEKTLGGALEDKPQSVVLTEDNGYLLASHSKLSSDSGLFYGGYDWHIFKLGFDGDVLWDKVFGTNGDDYVTEVVSLDKGFLISGYTASGVDGDKSSISAGQLDTWILKINSLGFKEWDKSFGGRGDDIPTKVLLKSDGSVIVSGYSSVITFNSASSRGIFEDLWFVNLGILCDPNNIYSRDATVLTSTACSSGVLTWSNGAKTSSITVSPNITTTYTATCNVNGCVNKNSNSITVYSIDKPRTPFVTSSNTLICKGGSVTLTASACENGQYAWSNGLKGNPITVFPNQKQFYKVICIKDGISSDSSNAIKVDVFQNPEQPKIIGSTNTFCQGANAVLKVNACTGQALWNDGQVGNTITIKPTETYNYRVVCQSSQGCVSDSSDVFIVKTSSSPSIISNVTCESSPSYFDWSRSYGGTSTDILTSSLPTSEGGFLLGGYSCSNMGLSKSEDSRGAFDYWVLKIDSQGLKLWDKTFGGNDNDHLLGLQPSSDGGYILGGSSVSNISKDKSTLSRGGYDYWVVKIDVNGNKVWDKSFGGKNYDYLTNIVSTPDGGYLLVGYSNSQVEGNKTGTNKGNFDYWVVKIDGNGNKVWDKTYGGSKHDITTGAILTRDNSFIILGYSYSGVSSDKSSSNQGDSDIWLLKINSVGSIIWEKTLGGALEDKPQSVVLTEDNGYLLASHSKLSSDSGLFYGGYDWHIFKLGFDGDVLWDKVFGTNGDDYVTEVVSLDKGFLISGYTASGVDGDKSSISAGQLDTWILKINSLGFKEWDKSFGGRGDDIPTKVLLKSDGSVIVSGYSSVITFNSASSRGIFEDLWFVNLGILCDPNNIYSRDATVLTSTACSSGVLTWSNGAKTSSITVSPNITTTYTATCNVNGCVSAASNAITVNPIFKGNSISPIQMTKMEKVEVSHTESNVGFKVFPNPAVNEINIVTELEGEFIFHLYNSIGQKVKEKAFEKKTKLSVNDLERGSHFYLIQNQNLKSSGKILLD